MLREKNVLPRVKGALIYLQFNCIVVRSCFTYVGSKFVKITGTSNHTFILEILELILKTVHLYVRVNIFLLNDF